MKMNIRTWALTAVTAGLLAACGGNDPEVAGSGEPAGAPTTKGTFSALVSFGDSVSDLGTYAPATSLTGNGAAPYFGGRFTVNGAGAKVWVEYLATTLGLDTAAGPGLTAAEVGFAGVSVKCPAAAVPALASTCTGYGQGGARVTDPNGIGKTGGALTVPVKTQIANHLARFNSFKASDLIVVLAGDNDALIQFTAFGAAATQIKTDQATGKITADQANVLLFQAQTAAQTAMKTAAQELTGYIRNEILGKGGKYVAVVMPVNFGLTPLAAGLLAAPTTAPTVPVLISLIDTFNLWLRDGLTNVAVKIIDPNTLLADAVASPAKYGLSNVTVPACDAAKISAITGGQETGGSSLFCNSTPGVPYNGLRTGADATTWLFADSIHPTPGGHMALSAHVAAALRGFGWI
jgi:phospholipase/lecithinase/hemolysin